MLAAKFGHAKMCKLLVEVCFSVIHEPTITFPPMESALTNLQAGADPFARDAKYLDYFALAPVTIRPLLIQTTSMVRCPSISSAPSLVATNLAAAAKVTRGHELYNEATTVSGEVSDMCATTRAFSAYNRAQQVVLNSTGEACVRSVKISPPQEKLRLPCESIKCVSFCNIHNKLLIPSTKNFVGRLQFKKIIMDSGSTSLLLIFSPHAKLLEVLDMYQSSMYTWELTMSQGVTSTSWALKISTLSTRPTINFHLCTDLLSDKTFCSLCFLRFYLSTANIKEILSTEALRRKFDDLTDITRLEEVLRSGTVLPERTYSLLGQSFLSTVDSVACGRATFYFEAGAFPITEGWEYIYRCSGIIRSSATKI